MGLFGRNRIKRPVQGHAVVIEASRPPASPHAVIGSGGNICRMHLRLEVPGMPPHIVEHTQLKTLNRWPEVGMCVAITVDADYPDRLDVGWTPVFGEVRGGVLGHGAEILAGAAGLDIDLSTGLPRDPAEEGMSVDEFAAYAADLNAEFAAGHITYEELSARLQRASGA